MTDTEQLLVPGTNITYKWLEDLMEAECSKRPTVTSVGPLTGEILGMMSTLRRVTFKWDSEDDQLPKSVVIKLPSAGTALKAMSSSGSNKMAGHEEILQKIMHDSETSVYQWFKKFDKKPLASPHIYAANNVESGLAVIVMEDFGDSTLVQLTDGFNEDQLSAIVNELADFHAFCFQNEGWKTTGFSKSEAMFASFTGLMKDLMRQLQTNMPGYWECISVYEKNAKDGDLASPMEDYGASGKPYTLTQGDLWCPQILWNGSEIAGIVDWQIAHPGSVMEDISRVLATCTKTELRRKIQTQLFGQYYERLKSKLEEKGMKVPFEREYLDSEYKSILPYTISMTIFATAMWTNSNVLKKGDDRDQERIMETFSRSKAFIEDALEVLGWK